MKSLIACTLLFLSLNSLAQRYECGTVGGIEEYAIYVGLDVKLACFFDNDTCVNLTLKDIKFYETMPPQTVYVFEGKSRSSGHVSIEFNLQRLSASVTEHMGTANESTMIAHDVCRQDPDIIFDDE